MKKEIDELAVMLDEIEKETTICLESWWRSMVGRDYFVDLLLKNFRMNMTTWAKRSPKFYKDTAQMIRETHKKTITGNIIPFDRVKMHVKSK